LGKQERESEFQSLKWCGVMKLLAKKDPSYTEGHSQCGNDIFVIGGSLWKIISWSWICDW